MHQGKALWVDSACADCPGFLVPGAAPAWVSTFVLEPHIVPLGEHFASWALGRLLGCGARSSPTTNAKTGRTAHVFTAHKGCKRRLLPPVRKFIPNYPLARDYYENNSLRIVFFGKIWRLTVLKSPGKKDSFTKFCVKFISFTK